MSGALEQAVGLIVFVVVVADIFVTVLYARAGSGLLAPHAARGFWRAIRAIARRLGSHRAGALSFGGPVVLVSVVGLWFLGLTVGTALVIHPALGTAVRSSSGETPRSFVAALYAGGSSVSIVGSSGLQPHTDLFRLFDLWSALTGTAVTSLVLTYLMQVYTALLRRNAATVKVDTWSGESGDAAQLVARLFPGGQTSGGYNNLSEFAVDMASVKETHHFYPVLFYFRFREPRYSMSRTALVALDAAALIKTALDDEHFGWIKRSAALTQLEDCALMLLKTLREVSDEGHEPREPHAEPADSVRRWQQRFAAAVGRLRAAGLPITIDEDTGAAEYVRLRSRWNASVESLASALGYEIEDVDPVVAALSRRPPLDPLAASV